MSAQPSDWSTRWKKQKDSITRNTSCQSNTVRDKPCMWNTAPRHWDRVKDMAREMKQNNENKQRSRNHLPFLEEKNRHLTGFRRGAAGWAEASWWGWDGANSAGSGPILIKRERVIKKVAGRWVRSGQGQGRIKNRRSKACADLPEYELCRGMLQFTLKLDIPGQGFVLIDVHYLRQQLQGK